MKVSDDICIKLQKAILTGKYPSHSRFPSERELAEKYQVSRPIIREAVAKLTQLGLVETRPKSGTYVSDFQTEGSIDLLIHIMKSNEAIDSEILISLLKIRRVAEASMAHETALKATPDDVTMLKDAGDELINCILTRPDDITRLSECDYIYHATLVRASHNLVYQLLFNSFKPIYKFYADYYYTLEGTHEVTINLVNDLMQAIRDKDGERAEAVMKDAILSSEERLIESLGLRAADGMINLRNGY